MDCKRAKALIEEGTGGPPGSERGALREHLKACEGCARESRELSETRSLLSAAPRYKAPAGFSARVMERIRLEDEAAREPGFFRWLMSMPLHIKAAEAAAAVLAISIGVWSAGFLSERIGAGQTAENYTELASLEELDTVPPGSMGDMYLSIKENGNEQ